ncbi:hypothetical protein F4677DRAFT_442888 [Hypoxylon crocopeplum]|nr:hypothetical protein F4677DRAFT_442888 [Hypoxylon crocopeplum]
MSRAYNKANSRFYSMSKATATKNRNNGMTMLEAIAQIVWEWQSIYPSIIPEPAQECIKALRDHHQIEFTPEFYNFRTETAGDDQAEPAALEKGSLYYQQFPWVRRIEQ